MAISDEQMQANLALTRPYTVVLLRPTARRHEPGADAIVREHGRRNMEHRDEGILSIVCVIPGSDQISGVGVYPGSVDEVRALMEQDPGVRAGIFTYELHAARSFPGDALPTP